LKRRLLTIVLAAVLAVFGAAAVFAYARQANTRAIDGLKTVEVIVAKGTINPRTSLGTAQKQGLLGHQKLPAESVPGDALRSTKGYNTSLVLNASMQPGQLLLSSMLVSASRATAAGVLPTPTGMQAVTVQMCVAEVVASYATAGSDVDVYATVPLSTKVTVQRTCSVDHAGVIPGGARTSLVLSKVLILSVTQAPTTGQGVSSTISSALADPANSSAASGTIYVTFAVTEQNALKLIQATNVELPYLGLLPTG
jgi:pilus assembly protein CpaB